MTATQSYDPWGTPQGGSGATGVGFAGELQNASSGVLHLRARWYNVGQGRFASVDPFPGMPEQPYSQHPYQYAYSNPVRWTDPSGRCVGWLWRSATCTFAGVDPRNWNYADGGTYLSGVASNLTDPVVGAYTILADAEAQALVWQQLQQLSPADLPGILIEGVVAPFYAFYEGIVCDDSYLLGKGASGIGIEIISAASTVSVVRSAITRIPPRFVPNKAAVLTGLDEAGVDTQLLSRGWSKTVQVGKGYEGQPLWWKEIDGVRHEVRMHPHATRNNPRVTEGMLAYHGGASRYGVHLVDGAADQMIIKPSAGTPLDPRTRALYDMDDALRLDVGDQAEVMKGGWALHYIDPFGFGYVDDAGRIAGVATDSGHMLAKGHPWLPAWRRWLNR